MALVACSGSPEESSAPEEPSSEGDSLQAPTAPANLSSPSKSATSVSLSWSASTDNVGVTGYDVYRDGALAGSTSSTSFTVTGLSANTAYAFFVKARDAAGNVSAASSTVSVTTRQDTGGGSPIILGYFAGWGVYDRNYHVKNIVTSGSASKLTHINYAFGNVSNGKCVLGDSYADFDRAYTAAESLDGVADTWDTGALRGSFNQLRKLKQRYPHIQVLFSFGGWTWSGGFAQAARNPEAFADSCYQLLEDPRWADVFDGIDIDWEYPNACGLDCDSSGPEAYVRLMSALRSRFGSSYLITSAVPAGAERTSTPPTTPPRPST